MKFKKTFITDPIFGRNFWFCVGDKYEFSDFVFKRTGFIVNNQNEIDGKNVMTETAQFMWVQKKDMPVFLHELMHRVAVNLNTIGIHLDDSTDEVYAFYFEFLYKECIKLLT